MPAKVIFIGTEVAEGTPLVTAIQYVKEADEQITILFCFIFLILFYKETWRVRSRVFLYPRPSFVIIQYYFTGVFFEII